MADEALFLKKTYADIVDDLLDDLAGPVARVALSDASEGSVMRTLVEAFSRELAVAYEQLGAIYRQGYLETATGQALDQVVALVGMERFQGGHPEGFVSFSRSTPADADIAIPRGTLVAGRGQPMVGTLNHATLKAGDLQVLVRVRCVEPTDIEVPPDTLDQMPRPVLGVERVRNVGALTGRSAAETDEELRERARFSLRRFRPGTVEGVQLAVRSLGIRQVEVREGVGTFEVIIGDADMTAELEDDLRDVLDEVRPAGVRLSMKVAEPVKVNVRAEAVLARTPKDDDVTRVRGELEGRIRDYLIGLAIDQDVQIDKVRGIILAHPDIVQVSTDEEGRALLAVESLRLDIPYAANGDLRLAGGRRAVPELVEVALNPPEGEVWVDLDVRLRAGAARSPALADQAKSGYEAWFAEEYDEFGPSARAVSWAQIRDHLPADLLPDLDGLTARITRVVSGASVELVAEDQRARLRARDRLKIRSVELVGG